MSCQSLPGRRMHEFAEDGCKVHLAMDKSTSDVRAVEFSPSRAGHSPALPELLGQIGTVTAYGAFNILRCHHRPARHWSVQSLDRMAFVLSLRPEDRALLDAGLPRGKGLGRDVTRDKAQRSDVLEALPDPCHKSPGGEDAKSQDLRRAYRAPRDPGRQTAEINICVVLINRRVGSRDLAAEA